MSRLPTYLMNSPWLVTSNLFCIVLQEAEKPCNAPYRYKNCLKLTLHNDWHWHNIYTRWNCRPCLWQWQLSTAHDVRGSVPSFTLTTYVSPFKANTSANWNAVSRHIWHGCHTSVDSGDLSQAPSKQSAVYSTCIIPAPLANCQFIWMASAFGMSATQPILGWL